VGRDVGGHADCDALTAVDQQVGETAGQHAGFLLGLIKVGVPVDGVLFDIGQHFHGHAAHTGFGVTVSSRGVAVHRTEVTLTIHQRVAQGEILCQTDHSVVNGCVAVGVIGAQHGTDGVGRLAVGMAGVVAALMHGIQNTAVDGLQAVAHIGQGAGHDDRHGVVQKCGLDLLFDVADDLFGSAARYHHIIFFHLFLRRV